MTLNNKHSKHWADDGAGDRSIEFHPSDGLGATGDVNLRKRDVNLVGFGGFPFDLADSSPFVEFPRGVAGRFEREWNGQVPPPLHLKIAGL